MKKYSQSAYVSVIYRGYKKNLYVVFKKLVQWVRSYAIGLVVSNQ